MKQTTSVFEINDWELKSGAGKFAFYIGKDEYGLYFKKGRQRMYISPMDYEIICEVKPLVCNEIYD